VSRKATEVISRVGKEELIRFGTDFHLPGPLGCTCPLRSLLLTMRRLSPVSFKGCRNENVTPESSIWIVSESKGKYCPSVDF
jgi:hypothetical protein